MAEYYVIINESQQGPFSKEQLASFNINPDTLVWRVGLSDWTPASELPELNDIIRPPFRQYSFADNPLYGESRRPDYNSSAQRPPYNQYNNPQNRGYDPYRQDYGPAEPNSLRTNWLPWAIVAAILGAFFSCIGAIFGIIGIVNANKANHYYNFHQYQLGDQANSTARIMTIIGFIIAGIGMLTTGFLLKFPGFWSFNF